MNCFADITKCRKRIEGYPEGFAFMAGDFLDLTSSMNARQCLHRLEKERIIRKIIHGVYERPKMSLILQDYSAPDIDSLAHALARNFKWSITPGGGTALNILEISTQVPVQWVYYSNGPYRKYQVGKSHLYFLHRTEKTTLGFNGVTLLVITALKELGEEHCEAAVLDALKRRLSKEDKEKLLKESKGTATWIYEAIKRICA